jgi:hypothetical protein
MGTTSGLKPATEMRKWLLRIYYQPWFSFFTVLRPAAIGLHNAILRVIPSVMADLNNTFTDERTFLGEALSAHGLTATMDLCSRQDKKEFLTDVDTIKHIKRKSICLKSVCDRPCLCNSGYKCIINTTAPLRWSLTRICKYPRIELWDRHMNKRNPRRYIWNGGLRVVTCCKAICFERSLLWLVIGPVWISAVTLTVLIGGVNVISSAPPGNGRDSILN